MKPEPPPGPSMDRKDSSQSSQGKAEKTTNKYGSELNSIRQRIDEIDDVIASLFQERLLLMSDVAKLKRELKLPVLDAERESEIIRRVSSKAESPQEATAITALFEKLIELSRKHQTYQQSRNK